MLPQRSFHPVETPEQPVQPKDTPPRTARRTGSSADKFRRDRRAATVLHCDKQATPEPILRRTRLPSPAAAVSSQLIRAGGDDPHPFAGTASPATAASDTVAAPRSRTFPP